jgi:hydrogenase nickel incorporation protein HypA/HybF
MHENHAVQNLVNEAIEKANKLNAKKVTKVVFGLGDMVGFDDGSIGLYYDQMTDGTLLEGAELVIKHYKPKFLCKDCSKIFEDPKREFKCPACLSSALSPQGGKEFFLENIETE